jgi:hypothetical protein
MTRPNIFEETYPNISKWIKEHGWIELGDQDDFSNGAFIRALDPGGLVWEAELDYPSLDDALRDMETTLKRWIKKNGYASNGKKRIVRKTHSR